MNLPTANHLLEINREFYDRFGESFSATRHRLQPGVQRILDSLHGDESILDLGCGNGELARVLAKRGHRGSYLGLDFSLPLLRHAESQPEEFPAKFIGADLTKLSVIRDQLSVDGGWPLITAFAVLHHIPSNEIRLDILKTVRKLLADDGRFILSNWQFLNSEKLKARIIPWASALSVLRQAQDAVEAPDEVDAGDYLLDWRSGGKGLRYAHHFSAEELSDLAGQAGFRVSESFLSDGKEKNLGLYQVWERVD